MTMTNQSGIIMKASVCVRKGIDLSQRKERIQGNYKCNYGCGKFRETVYTRITLRGSRRCVFSHIRASSSKAGDDYIVQNVKKSIPLGYGILASTIALGSQKGICDSFQYSSSIYFLLLSTSAQFIGAHRALLEKERREIQFREGLLAPVIASISLFGLYLQMKFFPDFSISNFLTCYFFLVGTLAIYDNSKLLLQLLEDMQVLNKDFSSASIEVEVPSWMLEEDQKSKSNSSKGMLELRLIDTLCVILGLAVSTINVSDGIQNYSINNLIACLIGADVMRLIGLKSYTEAVVFLVGLLAYDVFWVFASPTVVGDNVMMEVATQNIPLGPSRLLFPAPKVANSIFPYSLLGLGDVVVPALFTSLMLRFDFKINKNGNAENVNKKFFITALVSYALGLTAATAANQITRAGQPALLYLIPAMILGSCMTATLDDELKLTELLAFRCEENEKDKLPASKL